MKYNSLQYPWLFEIHLCFDLQFSLINCELDQIMNVHYPASDNVLPPQQLMLNGLNGHNFNKFSFTCVILSLFLSNFQYVFNEVY